MARIQNKLIFTNEGNRLLVSQVGGIKFAILGGFLVQGKEPCINPEELKQKYLNLTLEELLNDTDTVIGMKGVTYLSQNNDKVIPKNDKEYNDALKEIDKHLFGTYYMPALEYKKNDHYFGTYDFDFDKTDLMLEWGQNDESVSFSMFCLVGKQYAETDDATFNVNDTQNPSIVAVAQVVGDYDESTKVFHGGIQFLKEQNQYLSYKLRLVFSLTDDQEDSTAMFEIDEEVRNALDNIQLVNNGLKTNSLGITVDDSYTDDVMLNRNGSFATTKSMMIADSFDSSVYENQFNAAGLVHLLNKKDNDRYAEQIVFTSLTEPESITAGLTAYNAGMLLCGQGKYVEGYGSVGAGPYPFTPGSGSSGSSGSSGHNIPDYHWEGNLSPSFSMNSIPEVDNDNLYTVDIFGTENVFIGEGNADKSIFSQKNVYTNPVNVKDYGYEDDTVNNCFNVTIQSNENIFCNANTNNTLFKSNGNFLSENCHSNIIIGGDKNLISGGSNTNMLFATDLNYLGTDQTYGNILIGGHENVLEGTTGTMIVGGIGINGFGHDDQLILGQYNADSTAKVVYGIGSSDSDRRNALEFDPYNGVLKLFKNGVETVALGGDYGLHINDLTLSTLNVRDETVHNNLNVANNITVGSTVNAVTMNAGSISAIGSLVVSNNNQAMSYDSTAGQLRINNHQLNNYRGTSVDDGMAAVHALNTNTNLSRIYLNKDINVDTTESYSTGTITIHEMNVMSAKRNKVKITPSGIEFSKATGTTWERTNFIPAVSNTYTKIRMDLRIEGDSFTHWGYTITNSKCSENQFNWLSSVFKNTPVLTYCLNASSDPRIDEGIVWVNGGYIDIPGNLTFLGSNYQENVTAIQEQVSSMPYRMAFAFINSGVYCPAVVTPVNLDNIDPFDELEINIRITSFRDDRAFAFNWMPVTTDSTYSPTIKVNILTDVGASGTNDSMCARMYGWITAVKTEEGLILPRRYTVLHDRIRGVSGSISSYMPRLQCVVPKINSDYTFIDDGSVLYGWDLMS